MFFVVGSMQCFNTTDFNTIYIKKHHRKMVNKTIEISNKL